MAVSFSRTRTQIAQRVLGKVIKIGAASAASADYATVYEALDLRLKEMAKNGTFWRKVTSVPVTFSLTASVSSASAGAGDILFPLNITWSNGTRDEPVSLISYRDYAAIEDKATSGNPYRAVWKGGTEFVFYPVPSVNGTAKLLYHKIADDTSADSAVDVDVSMIRPLIDIIKYDLADDYGIAEQTIMRWRAEAVQAERDIRKLGAPRVSYPPVEVDDFDGRHVNSRRASDYGA